MQLMDNYCPYAAGLLCVLVPIFEPLGFNSMVKTSQQDTLLNYNYTPAIVGAIALTAVLGLLVSLSTFLVIGATSSLTYNVVSADLPSNAVHPLPTPSQAERLGASEQHAQLLYADHLNNAACAQSSTADIPL